MVGSYTDKEEYWIAGKTEVMVAASVVREWGPLVVPISLGGGVLIGTGGVVVGTGAQVASE